MSRYTLFTVVLFLSLASCGKKPDTAAQEAAAPLLVTPEDVITVRSGELASGPVVSGSVQAERRADLRAEVSAVVLKVVRENGEPVKKGDLVLHLDDTAIRDTLLSATAAVRTAAQSYEQAERQLQRLKTLRSSGMATMVQMEDAENRRNAAQSELVAARAREVQAKQQLTRTEVRAPFDGFVSDRKVSAGDTVQIGKELVKVIDPASMRFEGFVAAEQVSAVKVGQKAYVRVNGYGDKVFDGVVRRVDAAADPVTRQVQIIVAFTGEQPKVAGLYAEGRVAATGAKALTAPEAVLVRSGDQAYVWRINGDAVNKVQVVLGERDDRSGNYVVQKGIGDGDRVLRNPAMTLKDGQKMKNVASAAPSVPPSAANAGR